MRKTLFMQKNKIQIKWRDYTEIKNKNNNLRKKKDKRNKRKENQRKNKSSNNKNIPKEKLKAVYILYILSYIIVEKVNSFLLIKKLRQSSAILRY